jgi:caffeoyl-CoA O-methyltransferase
MRGKNKTVEYIETLFIPQDEELNAIRQSAIGNVEMQISPFEGQLIAFLLSAIKAKRVLEIGTFVGYSTLWIAKTIAHHDNAQVVTIERTAEAYEQAKSNFALYRDGALQNVATLLCGDALHEHLPALLAQGPEQFDAIFIDGKKAEYLGYLDYAEKLLRPGGLIIADNTLLYGEVLEEPRSLKADVVHQFNQRLSTHYTTIILPTEAGLTVALKISGGIAKSL